MRVPDGSGTFFRGPAFFSSSIAGLPSHNCWMSPIGAAYGAAIGVVLAPVASWTLLRPVPLGRAIVETAIGTLLGAVLGFPIYMVGPVLGGVIGFGAAALHLRLVVAPRIARARSTVVLPAGDHVAEE